MAGLSSAPADGLLSEDAFQNEHSQKLFRAIDELRTHGAHHEIELPELIIVGDQSAGKSSLLQSLTEIPFPVADKLCTRFPTRIVSKRTPFESESIKISIEPSPGSLFDLTSYRDRANHYAEFSRTIPGITAKEFKTIVDQATDLMGISRLNSSDVADKGRRNFCNDILKVEISGPNRSYFSILDLPGIFQSLTKDLTEAEKTLVKGMTTTHMSSKQSIIICVASGTNDLANQAVFDIASQQDPRGDRTVGVISKCDVSQHVNQLMDLARNTEKHFRHGWFVVRNRTPSEAETSLEPFERHSRERDFFENAPWNALPSHRRGTQALKKYLAELLCSHIQETFPIMLQTISDRIRTTKSRLDSLGEPRDAIDRKRMYLTKLAQNFHLLASQALRGRYDSETADNVKLRRMVREANDAFANDMKYNGHTVPFMDISPGGLKTFHMGSSNFNLVGSYTPLRNDIPFESQVHKDVDEYNGRKFFNVYQSISSIPGQRDFSFEEIRLRDCYQNSSNSKPENPFGPLSNTGSGGSASNRGNSLFGNPNRAVGSGFGPSQTSSGLFGAEPTPKPSKARFTSDSTNTIDNHAAEKSESTPQASSEFLGAGSATTPLKPLFPNDSTATRDDSAFSKALLGTGNHKPFPNFSGSGGFGRTGKSEPTLGPGSGTSNYFSNLFSGSGSFGTGTPSQTNSTKEAAGSANASDTASNEIYEWIRLEVKASRGTELQGILNPDVLPILFHKQIQKWKALSVNHFRKVSTFTVEILIQMLRTVCFDSLIRDRLEKAIRQASDSAEKEGHSKLVGRLQELGSRHLQTSNPAFEDKVREARLRRFHAALERYRIAHNPPAAAGFGGFASAFDNTSMELKIDMRDTASLFAKIHISNSQNLEDEIHDILKAYYEIAMNDFVENVNQLVVEPYLNDPKGPVLFFSPLYVGGLSDSETHALAAESPAVARERRDLEATLDRLNVARGIAEKYS